MYPNPSVFDPERYLDASGRLVKNKVSETVNVAFGFGRRCLCILLVVL
jgi:cytochrome P450